MSPTFSDELPVTEPIVSRQKDATSPRNGGLLLLLISCALVLVGRLAYVYVSDAERFPITTIKVAASYQHVTHKELEEILARHLDASFFHYPFQAYKMT